MASDENTPLLLPSSTKESIDEPSNNGIQGVLSSTRTMIMEGSTLEKMMNGNNVPTDVIAKPFRKQFPLPYLQGTANEIYINCQICKEPFNITEKRHQHVVKCPQCNEATPIREPPPTKNYTRCPCNCLLIYNKMWKRIACPRPNCKRVISLEPQLPVVGEYGINQYGVRRIVCAHCLDNFYFHTTKKLAKCPHCGKMSAIGKNMERCRGWTYFVLGLVMLTIFIVVTFVTASEALEYQGLFFLYIAMFVIFAFLVYKGFRYLSLKESFVEE